MIHLLKKAFWIISITLVLVAVAILYLVALQSILQIPRFEDVIEFLKIVGEFYLWPVAILLLVGFMFREPVRQLINRIEELAFGNVTVKATTKLYPPQTSTHETVKAEVPGYMFWLAYSIENTRLRLEWKRADVLEMLDQSVYYAKCAEVPKMHIDKLEQIRKLMETNLGNTDLWHDHAVSLKEVVFDGIAAAAQNSHNQADRFVSYEDYLKRQKTAS